MKFMAIVMACLALAFSVSTSPSRPRSLLRVRALELQSPEGWKVEKDDDSVTLTSADGSMAVVFVALPAGAADKGFELIENDA